MHHLCFSSLSSLAEDFSAIFSVRSAAFLSIDFSSVAQSCPTLFNPMDRSTPGLPVHHRLPGFTQTHVHRFGDAIQPIDLMTHKIFICLSLPCHFNLSSNVISLCSPLQTTYGSTSPWHKYPITFYLIVLFCFLHYNYCLKLHYYLCVFMFLISLSSLEYKLHTGRDFVLFTTECLVDRCMCLLRRKHSVRIHWVNKSS